MPRPLYPRGKSPRDRLDRKLCEPQSWSGLGDEEKKSYYCPYHASNPSHPARSLVSTLIELTQQEEAEILSKNN
jgi:hypothetical protein